MRKPLLIIAAVLAVLASLVVASALAIETRWFSDYLSGRLSEGMGRHVQWNGSLAIDWSLHPTVRLEGFQLSNVPWAQNDNLASVKAIEARLDLPRLLDGLLVVEKLTLQQPALHLALSPDKGSNWASLLASGEPEDGKPLLQPRFQAVDVDNGRLTWSAPKRDSFVTLTLDTGDGRRLRVQGSGRLRGHPISLSLTGDPLEQALASARAKASHAAYRVNGEVHWREHTAVVEGQTDAVTHIGDLRFDMTLSGPDADALAGLFGYDARSMPYRASATVQHHGERWSIDALDGHIGDNHFQGKLAYDRAGEKPLAVVDVQVDALDVGTFLPEPLNAQKQNAASQEANRLNHRIKQAVEPLRVFNADVQVRLGQLQWRDTVLKDVRVNMDLQSSRLQARPVSFTIAGGELTLTASVDASAERPDANADIAIEAVDLGRALEPYGLGALGHLEGHLAARLKEDVLIVEDSRLHYWKRNQHTDITAHLLRRGTSTHAPGVHVEASGQLRGQPLELTVAGGPLLNIDDPRKPYPLDADVAYANSTISAHGTVTQPVHLKAVDLQVHAAGPDPANLWYLTRVGLPHLPPYNVRAHMVREDASWYLRDIHGKVGNSDISGNMRWKNAVGQQAMLWADLNSQMLDLDDLLPLLGHPPDTGPGEAGSPSQERQAREKARDDEELPDGELMRQRLQSMDASVEFNAKRLRAATVPFDDVMAEFSLQDGVLRLQPLSLGVGPGEINIHLFVDTTDNPAEGDAALDVTRVNLKYLLSHFDIADDTLGTVGGTGRFQFSGDSVAQALAALQGRMQILMNDGQLDSILVEAAGLDLGEALFSLFGERPDPVDIQCLYADLNASNGIVNVVSLTAATIDSNFVGDGRINFEKEQYELVLEARPKDFSLFSAGSPVRLHGDFDSLAVDVVSDELLGRGALAVLGAAVFPPTALLPLVEPGDTSGQHGCSDMIAAAE